MNCKYQPQPNLMLYIVNKTPTLLRLLQSGTLQPIGVVNDNAKISIQLKTKIFRGKLLKSHVNSNKNVNPRGSKIFFNENCIY